MYALDEVAAAGAAFREAFARAQAFRPLYVKVKLLYGCNLRCAMCNHWRDARPRQLTTAQLRGLLDELAGLGCRKVHFTGGEPGLRPDLEELVAHTAARGIRPTLTSNATLVTRARARQLIEGGLRGINVSIDSPDPATHDRVRGLPGAWERAVEGLHNLRKERRHGKLAVALNTVVTRWNFRTLHELPKLALRVGARALRLLPVDEHTGEDLRLRPQEIEEWNAEVAPLLARRALRAGLMQDVRQAYPFGWNGPEAQLAARGEYALGYYRSRPCFAPYTHALVDHDGRVYVCCMARGAPRLGDLQAESFTAVWNGEAYGRVRLAMHGEAKLPPCARCDDFLVENRRLAGLLAPVDEPLAPVAGSPA